MLRDDINNALKDAMKAGDARRVSTLRLVNSSLKNADIEARGQGKPPLTDEDALGVLQKMIKQRQELAELYQKGGRPELAAQEQAEIEIISGYLPQQMSDIEAGLGDPGDRARDQRADHEGHGPRHGGAEGALCRQARLRQGERGGEEGAERGVARRARFSPSYASAAA